MSSTNANARPRFDPSPCDPRNLTCPPLVNDGSSWLPLISCPAAFPFELFEIAVSQLIHHPEYNSTLILRSDTVAEMTSKFPPAIPKLEGKHLTRVIHRKLLARRPGRDGSLEQYCSLYTSEEHGDPTHPEFPDTLLLTPIVHDGGSLPYYHPTVSHLAFRYVPSSPPTLRIEVVPLPGTPTDLNSRLYRTCLALLDTLDRYGWGALTNYKKRVHHDCLVPRETYQDLYLVMRERHKHLVDTWQEVTDPLKHVFEDIGIATYLMLLWKDTYTTPSSEDTQEADSDEPWKSWPRPSGGFLDFGCGNGLLTHILVQEGYDGVGIDLRGRTSWSHYPESTQSHLHVYSFDPSSSFSTPATPDFANPYFKPSLFLIGNHADELTPYLPVLSAIHSFSGYLSIPCCAWSFDAKYERTTTPLFPLPAAPSDSDPKAEMSWDAFSETLNLGGDGGKSSYSMYRVWLASLSVWCGWEVECEMLRIPSTRNWAIIGRRKLKTVDAEEAMENAMGILEGVVQRGIFKARKPEGKDNAH